jgi:hypothetical protein
LVIDYRYCNEWRAGKWFDKCKTMWPRWLSFDAYGRLMNGNVARRVIIVATLALAVAGSIAASQLKGADSLFTYWPDGHDFRQMELLSESGYLQSRDAEKIQLTVVTGVDDIDRSSTSDANVDNVGEVVWREPFRFDAQFQRAAARLCQRLRNDTMLARRLSIVDGSEVSCVVADWADWLRARQLSFPIDDEAAAVASLRNMFTRAEFARAHATHVGWSSDAKPRFVSVINANITATTSAQFAERLAIRDQWQAFVDTEPTLQAFTTESWFFVWVGVEVRVNIA